MRRFLMLLDSDASKTWAIFTRWSNTSYIKYILGTVYTASASNFKKQKASSPKTIYSIQR